MKILQLFSLLFFVLLFLSILISLSCFLRKQKIKNISKKKLSLFVLLYLFVLSAIFFVLRITPLAYVVFFIAVQAISFIMGKSLQLKTKLIFKTGIYLFFVIIIDVFLLSAISFRAGGIFIPTFRLEGEAMNNTLQSGELVFVEKGDRNFQRGDIVVFLSEANNNDPFAMRIIGLPEDKISFADGKVILNGEIMGEPYALGQTFSDNTYSLNSEEYFVLGDNRGKSHDSRFFGPIKGESIVGKVIYHSGSNLSKEYLKITNN